MGDLTHFGLYYNHALTENEYGTLQFLLKMKVALTLLEKVVVVGPNLGLLLGSGCSMSHLVVVWPIWL